MCFLFTIPTTVSITENKHAVIVNRELVQADSVCNSEWLLNPWILEKFM